jgi:hypothetical protein
MFYSMLLQTLILLFAMQASVQAQYLLTDNLRDEHLCRVAIRSCLKPVACTEKNQNDGKYCLQNQCHFKNHLTIGFRDVAAPLNIGDIYRSSVKDPFELDINAHVVGMHVLDCEDPAMAKSIIKTLSPEIPKSKLSPVLEISSKK